MLQLFGNASSEASGKEFGISGIRAMEDTLDFRRPQVGRTPTVGIAEFPPKVVVPRLGLPASFLDLSRALLPTFAF